MVDGISSQVFSDPDQAFQNKFIALLNGEDIEFVNENGDMSSTAEIFDKIERMKNVFRIITLDAYQKEGSYFCGTVDVDIAQITTEQSLIDNILDLYDFHVDDSLNHFKGFAGRDGDGHVLAVISPAPRAKDFVGK